MSVFSSVFAQLAAKALQEAGLLDPKEMKNALTLISEAAEGAIAQMVPFLQNTKQETKATRTKKVKKTKKKTGRVSGYNVFTKKMYQKVKQSLEEQGKHEKGGVLKEIGKRWKALEDDAKQAYKDQATAQNSAATESNIE